MKVLHDGKCAESYIPAQVLIETLRPERPLALSAAMERSFRQALIWHMQRHETRVVDLMRGSGVSRGIINKLIREENGTTGVENAMKLAAFYGKGVEEFVRMQDIPVDHPLMALAALLSPDEERLVEAQVRGILAARGLRERA